VLATLRAEGPGAGAGATSSIPWRRDFHEAPLLAMGAGVDGFVRDLVLWRQSQRLRRARMGDEALDRQARPIPSRSIPGCWTSSSAAASRWGSSPWDNLMKECREEAGMPQAIAENAKPAGIITLLAVIQGHMRVGLQFQLRSRAAGGLRAREHRWRGRQLHADFRWAISSRRLRSGG